MRHIILVWIFYVVFLFGDDTPLKKFYKSLDQNLICKMEIDFFQTQFGNTFNSSGVFHVISKRRYVYDSSSIKMIIEDSLVTTINHETEQLIYSSIEKDYLSFFDILSGHVNKINFIDKNNTHVDHFIVPNSGFKGAFEFDKNSDLLKFINLFIDKDQSLLVEVKAIDFIKHYSIPDIDKSKFDIIDFRD